MTEEVISRLGKQHEQQRGDMKDMVGLGNTETLGVTTV